LHECTRSLCSSTPEFAQFKSPGSVLPEFLFWVEHNIEKRTVRHGNRNYLWLNGWRAAGRTQVADFTRQSLPEFRGSDTAVELACRVHQTTATVRQLMSWVRQRNADLTADSRMLSASFSSGATPVAHFSRAIPRQTVQV